MKGLREILGQDDSAMPFLDHLEELRGTLIRSLAVLALGIAVALPLTPQVLELLKMPLGDLVPDADTFLFSMNPTGAFTSMLRMGFWVGILFSAPFLVFFIGRFIFPGLTGKERKAVITASGFSVILFVGGVLLGYIVTLPVAVGVMHRIHEWYGIEPKWTVNSYVVFTIHLLVGFGLAFQMPVVVMALGHLGLVESAQLRKKRSHVFVGLLVLAMFLTPPDPFTQLIMALPLYLLFEMCIWLLWARERRQRKA